MNAIQELQHNTGRHYDSIYLWMPMYGINEDPELIKRLGFPEGFTCVGAVALGYAAKEFKKPRAEEQRIEVAYIR